MTTRRGRTFAATLLAFLCSSFHGLLAQSVSQRGFAEARGQVFPQDAPNDNTQLVADLLAREELFVKAAPWLQLAGGADLRANSHDQVEDSWRVDWSDRGLLRPRVSIRRATATFSFDRLTLDVGKQFIRWGKTDVVNPTDRFAPRDFLNVFDAEFLGVTGARAVIRASEEHAVEVVWLPRFTPSRLPLVDQRWSPVPPAPIPVVITDLGSVLPEGAQTGIRWSRTGSLVEYSASFFNGVNHLPVIDARVQQDSIGPPTGPAVVNVALQRIYPPLRSYGLDLAVPTPWLTVKGEAAYFTSSSSSADEYVLFVVQIERQTGEWVFVGGYAGEVVSNERAPLVFAPDRGMAKSFVGRASLTVDANRGLALETALRQNLQGEYVKAAWSEAYGQHWRATISGTLLAGEPDDFLGQYNRNSSFSVVLRYSF